MFQRITTQTSQTNAVRRRRASRASRNQTHLGLVPLSTHNETRRRDSTELDRGHEAEETDQVCVNLDESRDQQGSQVDERARPPVLYTPEITNLGDIKTLMCTHRHGPDSCRCPLDRIVAREEISQPEPLCTASACSATLKMPKLPKSPSPLVKWKCSSTTPVQHGELSVSVSANIQMQNFGLDNSINESMVAGCQGSRSRPTAEEEQIQMDSADRHFLCVRCV